MVNQSTTPFGCCGLSLDWFTTHEIVIDFAIHQLLGPLISTVLPDTSSALLVSIPNNNLPCGNVSKKIRLGWITSRIFQAGMFSIARRIIFDIFFCIFRYSNFNVFISDSIISSYGGGLFRRSLVWRFRSGRSGFLKRWKNKISKNNKLKTKDLSKARYTNSSINVTSGSGKK